MIENITIITIIVGQYLLIGGLIYFCYRCIERQEKRVDTLMKYVKPDAYHKIKSAENLKQIQIPIPTREPVTSAIDKFLST